VPSGENEGACSGPVEGTWRIPTVGPGHGTRHA
jgi:hypothetical protein